MIKLFLPLEECDVIYILKKVDVFYALFLLKSWLRERLKKKKKAETVRLTPILRNSSSQDSKEGDSL